MPDDPAAPPAAPPVAPATEPSAPNPSARTAAPIPGDRPPRRLLDHAPSDRYAAQHGGGTAGADAGTGDAHPRASSPTRAVALGVAAAIAGAAIHLATAVALDWTGGLLLVAATAGLATGLAVRFGGGTTLGSAQRRLLGVVVALVAIAAALALNWAVSPRYLSPADYLDQVYGALVPLQLAVAAVGALIGTR